MTLKEYPYFNDEDKALKIFSKTVSFTGQRYEAMFSLKRDWGNLDDNVNVVKKRLGNIR